MFAPDSFQTPKQNAPVPSTAYKEPQPNARIAKADPSSNSIRDLAPPFSISFASDFFALPKVFEKPNMADMPPTKPKNAAAIYLQVFYNLSNALQYIVTFRFIPRILYFLSSLIDALGSLIFLYLL